RKVKEIEIEKEKIKLIEQELEEYNKKVADQEKKIKEQQEKIKEEEKKILAKQEEFRLQNIQREKEAERQLLIKQKELEEAAAKKQKELEESAAKKQKELEEVAAKKQEELNALKEKNEEIKDVIALSNTKVSQEISEQKKERELLKQQIDILRTEQEKNFQEIRRLNAIYYGSPRKGAVKNSNYSDSVFMVNKIESNLTHSAKSGKKIGDAFVNIKKGAWADEDLIEVEKTEFEIKKTVKGKKEDAGVLTETAKETKTLKDKAYEAIKNKDFEVAALYYRRVLEKDGADNFAKLSLATTYHTMGQYRQAKPLYLELMDVFPRSEQLVSNLISIMIQESPQETVYLIPGVADKHQDSALIQAQTSIAFAAAGKYPEAIKYIRRALAIVPGNIDFKYNLALFYDFNRNYEEAKRLYNEVLTADFSNKVRNDSIRKRLSSM
ncbi:MAG: tetratricopeptide repeat protein, partial [Rickettsiales bacterium]|nr:tetratricopeptide repeat protein [Rickettsiales bacterium]